MNVRKTVGVIGAAVAGAAVGAAIVAGVWAMSPAPETAPAPAPVATDTGRPDRMDAPEYVQPWPGMDDGSLECGTGAAPAVDIDPYGNHWAYCEPALAEE